MSPDRDSQSRRRTRGIFERPNGSEIWWVRYVDEHGRLHRERVGPKALAVKVYQKRKTEIQERRFFPERLRQRDLLVADAIADYLARREGTLRHFYHYQRIARLWSQAFQGKTLRQILAGDIERYVAKRIREVAPATVNRELAFLKTFFNDAVTNHRAETNPVRSVKMFRENNQRVRFLGEDEESRLFAAMPRSDWPLVLVALNTGLRQAEQFYLKWENVDVIRGVITIPRSKNGQVRHVPINAIVREALQAQRARGAGEWVFASAVGTTPIDSHNFVRRVFVPALVEAGIENFHWHDLRHTFASRLVMSGVELRTVQELMGHKTITMTLRYSHLSAEHQQDAVRKLEAWASDTSTDTDESELERAELQTEASIRFIKGNLGGQGVNRTLDTRIFSLLQTRRKGRVAPRSAGSQGLSRSSEALRCPSLP